MPQLFEIIDNPTNGLPYTKDQFKLGDQTPANYKVLRLMLGGITVTNLDTEYTADLQTNHLALFYDYDVSKNYEENICQLLSDSIEVNDIEKFFFDTRYTRKNKEFFKRLENECCNFLLYQSKGSYTTAFIFIYRILEVIYYSFTLIYASKTYDFKHTYGKLKEIFNSNAGRSKGELGFFKSAIKVMFAESDLFKTSINIDLEDEEFEKSKKIYTVIKSIFPDNLIFHTDTVENSKIALSFGEVGSFIVTIRNKFFHLFNRGDKNLESIELIDPDYFFSKMNASLFSWICVVYLEIIKFLLEEHLKYFPSNTSD